MVGPDVARIDTLFPSIFLLASGERHEGIVEGRLFDSQAIGYDVVAGQDGSDRLQEVPGSRHEHLVAAPAHVADLEKIS